MYKILMPVDGSAHSVRVAQFVTRLSPVVGLEVHVLYACEPVDYRSRAFMSGEDVEQQYAGEVAKATRSARDVLDAAAIPHQVHWQAGEPSDVILAECARLGCDQIVMGTRGASAITAALVGSVAFKVVHETRVPVTVVT